MRAPAQRRGRLPLLAAAVTAAVAVFSLAGAVEPGLVAAMRRQPSMLAGEPWRVATALLVQSDAWWAASAVLALFMLVAAIAERRHSRAAWCAAFAAGGLTGEIAGIFWQPVGSGVSVAGCGLLGLVLGGLLRDTRGRPAERLVRPAAGMVLAALLCVLNDIHGPPVFAGLAVAFSTQRPA